MVDRGVDLVIGAHPHCVQALDFYNGCPIANSVGNLVFDGAPTVASWNRGSLLEVGLNERAKISSVSLIPVLLEDGLPRMEVTESNRFGSR
jgi:poly-gamma-glutamate capsule biosynthesis protein CapA/YwtB (metallophosphatase superfamily)